jgi:O-succinylbenzoic acid--CoA ligase
MNHQVLTINHQSFTRRELIDISASKIRDENTTAWEKAVYEFIHLWLNKSRVIVQYSSGTTGRSKKIRLRKESMVRSAEITCRYFKLKRGQNAMLCLPVEYIAGKMMVVRSFVGQLNLQLTEPRSRPDIMGGEDIHFCAMVPMQVMNTFSSGTIPPIHKLIIGGAEITAELENLVIHVPVEIYATYGMAETCSHVAIRRINGPRPQPCYQALPGVRLETDERNCLVIKAGFLPAPVITNDQVEMEGTDRFRWIGRYDNLINSGGLKIVPEEVESVLTDKTGIACALISLPDEKTGQRLVVVVEMKKNPGVVPLILSELHKLLPVKIRPAEIAWIEKFPRNNVYKLDRRKLAEIVSHLP